MNQKDYFRMFQWLLLAACFYVAAVIVQQPQIETGLWKAGHITSGAYLGYWMDRHLFGRFNHDCNYTSRVIARAIIVGAAIFGMAIGL
jgi:hypothetical protein